MTQRRRQLLPVRRRPAWSTAENTPEQGGGGGGRRGGGLVLGEHLLLLGLLPHVRPPVVLDLVVGAAGELPGDPGPAGAPLGVEAEDEALLVGGDAAALEARVEVVDPAEAAALAGAPETCMEHSREHAGAGEGEERRLMVTGRRGQVGSITRHRANLRPELRNPNGVRRASARTIPVGRPRSPSTAPSEPPSPRRGHRCCYTWLVDLCDEPMILLLASSSSSSASSQTPAK